VERTFLPEVEDFRYRVREDVADDSRIQISVSEELLSKFKNHVITFFFVLNILIDVRDGLVPLNRRSDLSSSGSLEGSSG